MNITDFSMEELEEELERRKEAQNSRPQVKDNPKWAKVIVMAEDIVNRVAAGEYSEDNDDAHYMWEQVMETLYGEDFFEWFNKNAYR